MSQVLKPVNVSRRPPRRPAQVPRYRPGTGAVSGRDRPAMQARFRPTAHLYVASASDAIRHLRQGRGEGGFGEVATRAFCSPLHVLAERSEELATSARRR
jgi:hypothetical protein